MDDSITKHIQSLSPEIREMIYKEYVTLMVKKKLYLGFYKINNYIESAPFCEREQLICNITTTATIGRCSRCGKNDFCFFCRKIRKRFFPRDPDDYDDLELGDKYSLFWMHHHIKGEERLNVYYPLTETEAEKEEKIKTFLAAHPHLSRDDCLTYLGWN